MIKINHFKWHYELTDKVLSKYGSPYFSRYEVGEELRKEFLKSLFQPYSMATFSIPKYQFYCANEAYPESALNDPLADLELFDQWKSGIRSFPFEGQFIPLDITNQGSKLQNTGAVGVFGECITGMLAQKHISPKILVRPVHRWPDFILLNKKGNFCFCESKAYVMNFDDSHHKMPVNKKLLIEYFQESLQQLLADPSMHIHGFFVGIVQIEPFVIRVDEIMSFCSEERIKVFEKYILPEVVLIELIKRAYEHELLHFTIKEMDYYFDIFNKKDSKKPLSQDEIDSMNKLADLIIDRIKIYLNQGVNEFKYEKIERSKVLKHLKQFNFKREIADLDNKFFAAKTNSILSSETRMQAKPVIERIQIYGREFVKLRSLGNISLYMSNLTQTEMAEYEKDWQGEKENISTLYKGLPDCWVMGGCLFHVVEEKKLS